ncbi:hypothetical protein RJ640_018052 [Escallonia rubra]|uniref:Ricin B lectin domain-containing protein n=1 Tax=Escallonia rubra TaxID=112253 RepID=A0AA88UFW1_9ASTE|nr:hypothetical protein RJ640_018052 [Escallonia rubra]
MNAIGGSIYLGLLVLALTHAFVDGAAPAGHLKSKNLCSQCSKCDTSRCPPSEGYPHMTAFDNTLIAGALQSDFVDAKDRGTLAQHRLDQKIDTDANINSSLTEHRFSNYMDKCSGGQNYLTVDKYGRVSLRGLSSLESLAEADWKSINPPSNLNHHEFRFWLSRSTGKCLTVFGGKTQKRTVGVADCKFDGKNHGQLFAFRFHYHNNFCCCNVHNN